MFSIKRGIVVGLLFHAVVCQHLVAGPLAEYWPVWDVSNEANLATVDHSQWDAILGAYTVYDEGAGVVNFRYGDLDKSALRGIEGYVDSLEDLDPRAFSRLEQQAYWMNLYNALSVLAVVESLPELEAANFEVPLPATAWDKKRVRIAKEKLSLNDIEHRILRPIWKDHRILFGLNCATRDCPNLSSRAYTATTIKEQLKQAGSRFINHNAGLHYANGTLSASRLFKDYMADFASDEKMLKKVFAHYAVDMKALYVLGYTGTINFTRDARLNIP